MECFGIICFFADCDKDCERPYCHFTADIVFHWHWHLGHSGEEDDVRMIM